MEERKRNYNKYLIRVSERETKYCREVEYESLKESYFSKIDEPHEFLDLGCTGKLRYMYITVKEQTTRHREVL